jgi:hypothetical protein
VQPIFYGLQINDCVGFRYVLQDPTGSCIWLCPGGGKYRFKRGLETVFSYIM